MLGIFDSLLLVENGGIAWILFGYRGYCSMYKMCPVSIMVPSGWVGK